MKDWKSNVVTVRAIEGIHGIRGPHEKELADLGRDKLPAFRQICSKRVRIKQAASKIGGWLEHYESKDEWVLGVEAFPEVKGLMAYEFFGDEFGTGEVDELQFYFAGERVTWVPGEDLAGYLEVVTAKLERDVAGRLPVKKFDGTPSPMLTKALADRLGPFSAIEPGDPEAIAQFVGGTLRPGDNASDTTTDAAGAGKGGDDGDDDRNKDRDKTGPALEDPVLVTEPLPDLRLEIPLHPTPDQQPTAGGHALKTFPRYDVERLLVFTINHVLRYLKVHRFRDAPAPRICDQMFSGSYRQAHPDVFPERF